ncbi:leucine-rich repeat-containing protein 46-like [Ambystoma mexicanum]|uniref:leucine-rich repeat-containing protein 46-like n=1 Tax=Ambystoma mexicanum TaxID=8296 RepID=UPI0037E9984D
MSESSSGVNISSESFSKSYSSGHSDLSNTDTHIPFLDPRHKGIQQEGSDSGISSPLPCDTFRHITWQKLKDHDVQGTQLRCPRVREGPSEEELLLRGEERTFQRKNKLTEKEIWQQRLQENWENCVNLNLSFQDLGDPYQQRNFCRILRRLIRVERLWLVDNSLTDLSAIRLPRCRELNVSKNHFTSFNQLPKMPQIQHLSLAENNIETLSGISALRNTGLESLILKTNPCEFQEDYRLQVFSILPNLKMLDGIPKLPEDWSPARNSFFTNMCIIL